MNRNQNNDSVLVCVSLGVSSNFLAYFFIVVLYVGTGVHFQWPLLFLCVPFLLGVILAWRNRQGVQLVIALLTALVPAFEFGLEVVEVCQLHTILN